MRKRLLISVATVAMVVALMLPVFVFPTAAVAQPLDWEQVSADGFGFATPGEMSSAMCMAEYRGKLYAGTVNQINNNGCAVWCYDGGTDWTQVGSGGFGDTNNWVVETMAVYNDLLYVGVRNDTTGCEVFSYDGTNWTQEVGQGPAGTPTGPGFGDGASCRTAAHMIVFDGMLYVGAGRGLGSIGKVWAYDGSNWTQANTDGFGDANNNRISSLAIYNGQLHAGTWNNATGCEVWRYDGPAPANWTQINTDGFGDAANSGARVMEAWGGDLYVGAVNTNGPYVWTYDGATWTDVTPTFPDANNDAIRSMAVYKGALYVGVGNYGSAHPLTNAGTQVYRYGGGPPEQVNLSGFDGDSANQACHSLCVYQGDLYAGVINVDPGAIPTTTYQGAQVWRTNVPSTWYLAEGATAGDFETFVLVQNPNPDQVTVDVTFMTSTGPQLGPQNFPIPPDSRVTFFVNDFVNDYNVSTQVNATGGDVICERAMYGNNRTWAHDSIGVTMPSDTWYLAEGATAGGFETFVLVQNPNPTQVTVDLDFMTSGGAVPGPQGFPIPGDSRVTLKANDYVTDFNVSTQVNSMGGDVICERAMYGNNRVFAHDSIGVTMPSDTWYLAEGATAGDFETFVLVQNPNATQVTVDLDFMTSGGPVPGPQNFPVPGNSRVTFKANDYVTDFNVSTQVTSTGGDVICERAMYGNNRIWAHDSIGTPSTDYLWYLAEGSTMGGMETFVLVQNPNPTQVTVDVNFMTSTGPVPGPQGFPIAGNSRVTFKVNDYVTDFNVSTEVIPTGGGVICERAMYGNSRTWAHDSIGYAP
jgi:hypothetical protein